MTTTIAKRYRFEAAHFLPQVAEGHKCKRLHGHSWQVEIICEGVPDERGMVVDYFELDEAWQPIYNRIDHCLLNDLDEFSNPTTENIAATLLRTLKLAVPCVVAVRVYEKDDEWCEVRA